MTRRFQEDGGEFRQIGDIPADDLVAIYKQLYKKRWSGEPLGKEYLATVFQELHDMLCADVLFLRGRPVGVTILYKHETSRWLFVNDVQGGFDPEFADYRLGNIMNFRNIRRFEEEAGISGKTLRHCFGWNGESYKAEWTVEVPAYRLTSSTHDRALDRG